MLKKIVMLALALALVHVVLFFKVLLEPKPPLRSNFPPHIKLNLKETPEGQMPVIKISDLDNLNGGRLKVGEYLPPPRP